MPTYEIIPETTIKGYNLDFPLEDISISSCRNMCNKNDNCEAFVWKSEGDKSSCILKRSWEGNTGWDSQSTLYIKKGNPSYWWLWIFLALLGIIIFFVLCKGKKR